MEVLNGFKYTSEQATKGEPQWVGFKKLLHLHFWQVVSQLFQSLQHFA